MQTSSQQSVLNIADELRMGLAYHQSGQLKRAGDVYSKILEVDPLQPDALHLSGLLALEAGDLDGAERLILKALEVDPVQPAFYNNLGNAKLKNGRLDEAVLHYKEAILLKSDYVQAWFSLGNAYQQSNQYEKAVENYRQALKIDPDFVEAWFNMANIYREQNQIKLSLQCYQKAIELKPRSGEIYLNMGIAHKLLGNLPEAEKCYRSCIAIPPELAEAYYNLGNLYKDTGRFDQAVHYYQRSLAIKPKMLAVLNNLGDVYRQQGKFDAAVEYYHRSLAIQPDHAETLHNLGNALIKLNRSEEAIMLFKKAIEIKPDLKLAYSSMGSACLALDRIDEAEAFYRQALEKDPSNSMVFFNLGVTFQTQGKYAESKKCFRQALDLVPGLSPARWQYHLLLPVLYDNEEKISYYRRRFEKGLDYLIKNTELRTPEQHKRALEGISSITNFYLSYQGKADLGLQKKFGNFAARIMAANYPQWAWSRKMPTPIPESKIRVGFVSAYMYFHTVGSYLNGWVEKINHQEFEIFGYHIGNKTDALTGKLKNVFDHYLQVSDNIALAAQRIAADDLHVLVFPDIGMNPLSIMLAALRLAPVQCTSWGHPVTTGLPTMDYFLSSDLMEPENAQSHYSERLIRLPNIALCYQIPAVPKISVERKSFGLNEQAFVYLSPQSLFKYLPQYDDIFPRIAQKVNNAKFIFISHPSEHVTRTFKDRLAAAFEKYQIDIQSYCLFLPRLNFDEYLSLNLVSNVLLDTPEWSGGKTSIEGISCGLPVVTIPGEFMRGRHTYAMLKMMDIDETIAEDIDHYIVIAVRLGKDNRFYSEIKEKINSSSHRLFNDYSVPQALECFFKMTVKEAQTSD